MSSVDWDDFMKNIFIFQFIKMNNNNNINNKTFIAKASSFLKKSFATPKINVEPYEPKSSKLSTSKDIWTLENVWSPMNVDIDDKFK